MKMNKPLVSVCNPVINILQDKDENGLVSQRLSIQIPMPESDSLFQNDKIRDTEHYCNIVCLLDTSGSMNEFLGGSTRINYLVDVVKFIHRVRNDKTRMSLVKFAYQGETIYSEAKESIKLGEFEMGIGHVKADGGTNYENGLKEAINEMKRLNQFHKSQKPDQPCLNVILMITDGEPNEGNIQSHTHVSVWNSLRISMNESGTDKVVCIGIHDLIPTVLKNISKCGSKESTMIVKGENDISAAISEFFTDCVNTKYRSIEIFMNGLVPNDCPYYPKFYHHLTIPISESEVKSYMGTVFSRGMKVVFPPSNENFITGIEVALDQSFVDPEKMTSFIQNLDIRFTNLKNEYQTITFFGMELGVFFTHVRETQVNESAAALCEWAKANQIFDRIKEMVSTDNSLAMQNLPFIDERLVKLHAFCKKYPSQASILQPIIEKLVKWKKLVQTNASFASYLGEAASQFDQSLKTQISQTNALIQKVNHTSQVVVDKLNTSTSQIPSPFSISPEFISKYSRDVQVIKCEFNPMDMGMPIRKVRLNFTTKGSSIIETENVFVRCFTCNSSVNIAEIQSIIHFANHPELNGKMGLPQFITCTYDGLNNVHLFFKRENMNVYTNPNDHFSNPKINEMVMKNHALQLLEAILTLVKFEEKQNLLCSLTPFQIEQNEKQGVVLTEQQKEDIKYKFKYHYLLPSRLIFDEFGIQFVYYPEPNRGAGTATFIRHIYQGPEAVYNQGTTLGHFVYGFGTILYEWVNKTKLTSYNIQWIPQIKQKLGIYFDIIEKCREQNPSQRISIHNLYSLFKQVCDSMDCEINQ